MMDGGSWQIFRANEVRPALEAPNRLNPVAWLDVDGWGTYSVQHNIQPEAEGMAFRQFAKWLIYRDVVAPLTGLAAVLLEFNRTSDPGLGHK